MDVFVWQSGSGFEAPSLARLRQHFTRPTAPMGEAWFMGDERYLFDYLCGDIDRVPPDRLMRPLEEIASGTINFGVLGEWTDWYHYLLAALIPRSHECWIRHYMLEHLVTAFMALYPDGVVDEPYKGFRDDALQTLGRCIMDGVCWNGSEIVVGNVLHPSNNNPAQVWLWWDASGDFSASMFFCLKYLPASAIPTWLRSALSIPSPHWRAQLVVWLIGAYKVLDGSVQWPSQLDEHEHPSISWSGSHCLRPTLEPVQGENSASALFIPEVNRHLALQTLYNEMTPRRANEWVASISTVDYLQSELGGLPEMFARLYVPGS